MRVLLAAFVFSLFATSARADLHLINPPDGLFDSRLPFLGGAIAPVCVIKGNIDRNGARVYFLPRNANYHSVRVDRNTDERWFCSATEARRAGFRPARR